jgi:sulfofructose kinase
MVTVLCVGVAVVDFVFQLKEFPRAPRKHRADDAAVIGGGCAANAGVAVARLGGRGLIASRLGDDVMAQLIENGLAAEGVDCTLLKRFPGHRSAFSSVYVDAAGERQIVGYRDHSISTDAGWLESAALPHDVSAILADNRWPKGMVAAMRMAQARGIPGVIDAETPLPGSDIEQREGIALATHVAFSRNGLAAYAGAPSIPVGLARAAEMTSAFICVTDGPDGVFWLEDGTLKHMPAFAVTAVDTLGAGDIWHGAFAFALGRKDAVADAIRFANAVAGLKCTRFGGRAGTPTLAETQAFLELNG